MRSTFASVLLGAAVLALGAAPLFGQATFLAGSVPGVAADIGVTELTGAVTLTINSGLSVASNFAMRYSTTLSNDLTSGITASGTGALAGVTVSMDPDPSVIIVKVPAGGVPGNTITVSGVRVALAGNNFQKVTVTVTGTDPNGNAIIAGQGTLTVISSILQPFSVTLSSTDLTASILVKENYPNAFTSAVGVLGQTVPSRLRINPFPAVPQNVTLTFPKTVTAPEDGAFFTTSSGADETVPRKDGTTTVDYIYTGPAIPSTSQESFNFSIPAMVQFPSPGGSIAFQATLLPIGVRVPNAQFPSTDIPRYSERAVPDTSDLITGSSKLVLPFQDASSGVYTGIAITNPIGFPIKLTLTAFDINGTPITGTNVTNPVSITMPQGSQLAKIANEIFGQGFNASGPGTIVASGQTPVLAGFYLQGRLVGQGLDGTTAASAPVQSWVWPSISRGGASAFTQLQIFNPGTSKATATLKLLDSSAKVVAVSTPTIPAGGTVLRDLRDLFPGVNLNSFSGGYVTGDSDIGVIASENFGNVQDFNILQGQTRIDKPTYLISHFASGGGYLTEINLINADQAHAANITLTAFDGSGARIGIAENPIKLTIAPGAQAINTIDRLFPTLPSSLTTGYLQVDVDPVLITPFGSISPPLIGSVRFSATDGSGSAALPLLLPLVMDFVYSHVAQDLGFYTGVALLNANSVASSVKLSVLKEDGSVVGSFTTTLQPGQKISNLLFELVPASAGQIGGYIRLQSEQPIMSFSIFGTTDLKVLSAVPPQNVAH